MNYEKKYKEALERAKGLLEGMDEGDYFASSGDIENIFPELKESKDDRIVRCLLNYFNHVRYNGLDLKGTDVDEVIVWLEKQGESNTFEVPETSIKDAKEVTSRMQYIEDDMKPIAEFIINYANWDLHKDEWNQPTLTVPLFRVLDALVQRGKPYGECVVQNIEKQGENKHADKVEPKFKVGDWITNGDYTWKIVEVKPLHYILQSQDGNIVDNTISYVDEQFHSFTIEDAKDGDVLVTTAIRNCPFIYRKTDYNNNLAYYYAGIDGSGDFCEGCIKRTSYHFGPLSNVVPATKEQRDQLFQKMEKAGYKWNAEKKELKKIEVVSKESKDERIKKTIIRILKGEIGYTSKEDIDKYVTWLEKQGKRLG